MTAAEADLAAENARLRAAVEAALRRAAAAERERDEALEQQPATAEILSIISTSPTDLQPVFTAVAERAQRLLAGDTAAVWLLQDDGLHVVADLGPTPSAALRLPVPRTLALSDDAPDLQAVREGRTVHVYGTPDEIQPAAPSCACRWCMTARCWERSL